MNARRGWLWVAALAAAAGCYVTAPLKPSELVRLDGYRDGEPKGGTVSLLSPDNKPTEVAGDSKIFLDLSEAPWRWNGSAREPGRTYGGTFKSIDVSNGIFNGLMDNGEQIQVPLASIQAARVTEPNRPLRGPLYVVLTVAGALLLLTGVAFYALTHQHCGESMCVGGRALRVAREAVTADATDAAGWETDLPMAAYVPPEVRGALARLWTESARAEHASIPAFSRLSLSLVALGAPAHLVEAAHRAALDEMRSSTPAWPSPWPASTPASPWARGRCRNCRRRAPSPRRRSPSSAPSR